MARANKNNLAADTPDVMEHAVRLVRMARRCHRPKQNISRAGVRLLTAVLAEDGIRTSELAELLDLRPSSLTDALKRLEGGGFIERKKDPDDARVIRVYITAKGRQELEDLKARSQYPYRPIDTGLTQEEAELFCQLCEKIYLNLEKSCTEEDYASGWASKAGRGGRSHHSRRHRRDWS